MAAEAEAEATAAGAGAAAPWAPGGAAAPPAADAARTERARWSVAGNSGCEDADGRAVHGRLRVVSGRWREEEEAGAEAGPGGERALLLSGERAVVVMTLELDAGKPLGEHVLASFRTNTMYNADLVLKEPDFPMSPTQVTAYSDLVESVRSVPFAEEEEAAGVSGVAGIGNKLLRVWEPRPGHVAIAMEVLIPPVSVEDSTSASLEISQFVTTEQRLPALQELGLSPPPDEPPGPASPVRTLQFGAAAAEVVKPSPTKAWPSNNLSKSISKQIVQQGAARTAIPARRWFKAVNVINPMEVESFSVDCGLDRLLCIQISNLIPESRADPGQSDLRIHSIHIQCKPSLRLVTLFLGDRPTESSPVVIPSGRKHSFVVRPLLLDENGQTFHGEIEQALALVSCSSNRSQSQTAYQHKVEWHPAAHASFKLSASVSGEAADGPEGFRAVGVSIHITNLGAEPQDVVLHLQPGAEAEQAAAFFFVQSSVPVGRLAPSAVSEVHCDLVLLEEGVVKLRDFIRVETVGDGRLHRASSEICVVG